jgi:hypothetical protein
MKLVNHALGTQGRIHLADAAFLNQDVGVAVEQSFQLPQLLVHGYNDAYSHILYFIVDDANIHIFVQTWRIVSEKPPLWP